MADGSLRVAGIKWGYSFGFIVFFFILGVSVMATQIHAMNTMVRGVPVKITPSPPPVWVAPKMTGKTVTDIRYALWK